MSVREVKHLSCFHVRQSSRATKLQRIVHYSRVYNVVSAHSRSLSLALSFSTSEAEQRFATQTRENLRRRFAGMNNFLSAQLSLRFSLALPLPSFFYDRDNCFLISITRVDAIETFYRPHIFLREIEAALPWLAVISLVIHNFLSAM